MGRHDGEVRGAGSDGVSDRNTLQSRVAKPEAKKRSDAHTPLRRTGFNWEPDHEALKKCLGISNGDAADHSQPGLSKQPMLK
jgi:hypothetical protein